MTATTTIITIAYVTVLILGHSNAQEMAETVLNFDYDFDSQRGPNHWENVNIENNLYLQFTYEEGQEFHNIRADENECDSRSKQSPVNLLPNAICMDTHEILTRQIRSSDCKFDDFTWSITPHTLRASMPLNNEFCNRPHIDLPNGFGNKWPLQYMELHMRAEHTLDGRRYDAELQMVHLGTEPNEEKLAVISMMMDVTSPEDDEMVQWMIDEWQAVADEKEKQCADATSVSTTRMNNQRGLRTENTSTMKVHRSLNPSQHPAHVGEEKFYSADTETLHWEHPSLVYGNDYRIDNTTGKIHPIILKYDKEDDDDESKERRLQDTIKVEKAPRNKMFPYRMFPSIYYYRYKGSLTAPPCSRIVHWRILDEPRSISLRQYKQMADILKNYRNDACQYETKSRQVTGENWRNQHLLTDDETTHCQAKDFNYWRYDPDKI